MTLSQATGKKCGFRSLLIHPCFLVEIAPFVKSDFGLAETCEFLSRRGTLIRIWSNKNTNFFNTEKMLHECLRKRMMLILLTSVEALSKLLGVLPVCHTKLVSRRT